MNLSIKNRKNRKSLGFTLIELLVVVLILGILMAVALPLYLSSVKTSGQRVVAGNLKTMANAAQAFKVKSTAQAYPTGVGSIIGAGTDIESMAGPNGVVYSVSAEATGSPFCVVAEEKGNDVFRSSANTDDKVYYNPVTGLYGKDVASTASKSTGNSGTDITDVTN